MASNVHFTLPTPSAMNGVAFMKKLGLGKALTALKESGWAVKLTAKKLSIEKGTVQFTVPIDLGILHAVNDGKLTAEAAQGLSDAVMSQVKLALATTVHPGQLLTNPFDDDKDITAQVPPTQHGAGAVAMTPVKFFAEWGHHDKINLIKEYRECFGVGLKEAKDAVEAYLAQKAGVQTPAKPGTVVVDAHAWPTFALDCLQTAKTVKLRDATKMYQPVQGTSGGSRYFMIAADKDVRIAARYSGTQISIRIEGPGWKKHKAVIEVSGWTTISPDKDYASLHLEVGEDTVMANKTLGAVLMGLGLPLETPFPNLMLIKGKGA